jgi:sulfotransferase
MLSGIPRSGSTVLASLLSQHPDIHTTTTSPILDLMNVIKKEWDPITGHLLDKNSEQLKNILTGMFLSSYSHIEKSIIIDKHREWPRHIKFMSETLGHKPKIICTTRDIAEVLASFILLIESNKPRITYIDQELIDSNKPVNNATRCRHLWEKYISVPWKSLKLGKEYDKSCMLFLDYKDIVGNPKETTTKIFNFLEIDTPVNFNYSHLTPKPENDKAYGLIGLHDIRSELKKTSPPAEDVLGKDIANYYRSLKLEFWNE